MPNNQAFIDAIIAGAGGGAQTAWLSSSDPNTYNTFATAVNAIATAVDALIPPIVPGPSLSQINLLKTIASAVFDGRYPTAPAAGTYGDIATRIVILYTKLAVSLGNVPNIYAVGGVGIGGVYVVDNITAPTVGRDGTFSRPFATLQEAIDKAVVDVNRKPVILIAPEYTDTTALAMPTSFDRISFIGIGKQTTITNTITYSDIQEIYFQDLVLETTAAIVTSGAMLYAPPKVMMVNCTAKNAIDCLTNDFVVELVSTTFIGTLTAISLGIFCDDYSYQHLINATLVGTVYYACYGVGPKVFTGTVTTNGLAIGSKRIVSVSSYGVPPNCYAVPKMAVDTLDYTISVMYTDIDWITVLIENISRASTNFNDPVSFLVMRGAYTY